MNDVDSKINLVTQALKKNLQKKYKNLEEATANNALNASFDSGQNQSGNSSGSAMQDIEPFIDDIVEFFEQGFLDNQLQISGNFKVNTIEADSITLASANNMDVGKVLLNAFGDSFLELGEINYKDIISNLGDIKLKNQTFTNSTFNGGVIDGAIIRNSIFEGLELESSVEQSEIDDGMIQTLGLVSHKDGRLNFRLKPMGPDFPDIIPSSGDHNDLIVDTPTYFRFFYNDKNTEENINNSFVPLADISTFPVYSQDLFAMRVGIDKSIFGYDDNNNPIYGTYTKRLNDSGNWDQFYPPVDSWNDTTTTSDEPFYFKFQEQRVSTVLRSSEILFELPNNLEYLSGYSNFYINDMDVRINKDIIVAGNLVIQGQVEVANEEPIQLYSQSKDFENTDGSITAAVTIGSELGSVDIFSDNNQSTTSLILKYSG